MYFIDSIPLLGIVDIINCIIFYILLSWGAFLTSLSEGESILASETCKEIEMLKTVLY